MGIEFLPEDFMVAAEMTQQGGGLTLSVLPALTADDCRKPTSQYPDIVWVMPHRISEFCSERPALLIKVGLISAGSVRT